jgi:hypothetical protein
VKNWLRWTFGILFVLSLLIGAFWWEENWRGRKIWEETCARLRAVGEPAEIADIIPPPIPDEKNVAAAPIFAEVFAASDAKQTRLARLPRNFSYDLKDGSEGPREPLPRAVTKADTSYLTDWQEFLGGYLAKSAPVKVLNASPEAVLQSLSHWNPEWDEVAAALQRPKCRWPLDYEHERNVEMPHFSLLGGVSRVAHVRRLALAVRGDSQAYTDTLLMVLKLARTCSEPPVSLISHVLGMGMEGVLFSDWQNTIACVDLDEAQLQALQQQVEMISLKDAAGALQCERVRTSHMLRTMTIEEMVKFVDLGGFAIFGGGSGNKHADKMAAILLGSRPAGWQIADAALFQDLHVRHVMSCMSNGNVTPASIASLDTAVEQLRTKSGGFSSRRLLAELLGHYGTFLKLAAKGQARANGAVGWCALERFRLKHGRLPEKLEELVPEFVSTVPSDPVNGLPLRYVRKGERDYLLYSIGWNLKDEGGVKRRGGEGDWVWASSPKLIQKAAEEE